MLANICLFGMIEEYGIFLENLPFPSVSKLMEDSSRTNESVRSNLMSRARSSPSSWKMSPIAILKQEKKSRSSVSRKPTQEKRKPRKIPTLPPFLCASLRSAGYESGYLLTRGTTPSSLQILESPAVLSLNNACRSRKSLTKDKAKEEYSKRAAIRPNKVCPSRGKWFRIFFIIAAPRLCYPFQTSTCVGFIVTNVFDYLILSHQGKGRKASCSQNSNFIKQ